MLRNDCIVKYSVDPALTDIRGEFPRRRKLIWVVTPAVGPLRGERQPFLFHRKFRWNFL